MGGEGTPHRRGRRRSTEVDEAILATAEAMLAGAGLRALTMEGVAARAGVGRPTVYLRWSNKTALTGAVLRRTTTRLPVPDTGSTRQDLVAFLDAVVDVLTRTPAGRLEREVIAELDTDVALHEALQGIAATRQDAVGAMLRRAVARGDLDPEVDWRLFFDLLVAPVHYRFLFGQGPLDARFTGAVVDMLLRAFAPPNRGLRRPRRR